MSERDARGGPAVDHEKILDGLDDPVLVISREFRVVYMNAAARARYGSLDVEVEAVFCHALLHKLPQPCFERRGECPVCTVFDTGAAARVVHSHVGPDGETVPEEIVTSPLRDEAGRVAFVIESVRDAADLLESKEVVEHMRAELGLLRGVLPTCAGCKRIRTPEGRWQEIEAYVEAHSAAEFTHGLCPTCVARLYPGYRQDRDPK